MKGQRQPKTRAKAKSKGRKWQANTRAKTKCNDKGKGKDKVKDKGKVRIKDNGKDTGKRKDNGKVMAESKDNGLEVESKNERKWQCNGTGKSMFQVFGRDLVTMHGEVEGESMVLVHGTGLTAFSGRNPDAFMNEAVQVDFVHGKPYEGFMKTNK